MVVFIANIVSVVARILIGARYQLVCYTDMLPAARILAAAIFGVIVLISGAIFLGRPKKALGVVFFLIFVASASYFSSLAALSWVNGAKDESASVERMARVTGHNMMTGKRPGENAYFAQLEPWLPGQKWLQVQVTQNQHSDIVHATKTMTARLVIHAGRLGWEWIDTVDIV